MAGSTNHVLPLPKRLIITRSFQLAIAIAVMGLMAYGITYLTFDGDDLMMFTAIATIIITVYIIVAETAAPVIYNYWAILGLDIFAIIFWVISFSILASEVAQYQIVTYDTCAYYYYGYCYKKRGLGFEKRATTDVYTYRNSMVAACCLGGLEFVLFLKTLIFTSLALHSHRKNGGHCTPNSASPAAQEASVESGYGAPSFATTAVEPKTEVPVYQPPQQPQAYEQHQQAAPMHVAGQGTGQGFGAQPAYA